MDQIRARIMRGAFWIAVAQHGSQIINIVALVVLARLLDPGDFGGLSMALLVISFLGIFCDAGLVSALIQKQTVTEEDLSAAFWGQGMLALVVCGIVLAGAPLAAIFFKDDRLTLTLRCLAVLFLLIPLNAIPEVLEAKILKYDLIAVAELIGSLAGTVAAVLMAMQQMGLWSLAGLEVVKRAVRGVVLMGFVGWRPTIPFSIGSFLALFRLGKPFALKNIIFYFTENVDGFLIGRMMGPAALGLYGMGYKLSSYPVTRAWNMFGEMLFPAFSMMGREHSRLKVNLLRVSWLGGYFLIPLILLFFFSAAPIVLLVVGSKWMEIVPVAQLFCVLMFVNSVSFGDEAILLALGRVQAVNGWKLATSVALLVSGYFAIKLGGLVWLTATAVVCAVLHVLVIKAITFRALGLRWLEFFRYHRVVAVVSGLSLVLQWSFASIAGAWKPVYFVAGQLVLTLAVLAPFVLRRKIVDLKHRKLHLERIAAVNP